MPVVGVLVDLTTCHISFIKRKPTSHNRASPFPVSGFKGSPLREYRLPVRAEGHGHYGPVMLARFVLCEFNQLVVGALSEEHFQREGNQWQSPLLWQPQREWRSETCCLALPDFPRIFCLPSN